MPRSNNAGNLTPNSARTPEQLKAMGAKGGKASAEARKKRRATKELARAVLAMTPKASRKAQRALAAMGYDVEADGAPTVELLGLCAVAQMYMAGDLAAARFLYDYAQVGDIKTALERERIRAAERAKQPAATRDDPLEELLERIDDEALADAEADDAADGDGEAP